MTYALKFDIQKVQCDSKQLMISMDSNDLYVYILDTLYVYMFDIMWHYMQSLILNWQVFVLLLLWFWFDKS